MNVSFSTSPSVAGKKGGFRQLGEQARSPALGGNRAGAPHQTDSQEPAKRQGFDRELKREK